jgi:hypothetical protein
MIICFLSLPAGLCCVLGVSAGRAGADVLGVVGQVEGADEVLQELPFGAERGEQGVRPGLACVAS